MWALHGGCYSLISRYEWQMLVEPSGILLIFGHSSRQRMEKIIKFNNFSRRMSGTAEGYDENQETIQFYKIKLMEREREISSFEAKFKKMELKNNRDVKELKIAQEKAKNSLKDERLKLDKINKKVHELTEQNAILQHRMNQLKEEKDKEIETVRNQYNHLKQEVRSYERILPTHTFLSQLGATLEQLPTFQQLFMNCKDKEERLEQLQKKFKAYKEEMQQKVSMQSKVQESLKKKKNQLEKQLRDDIAKLLEVESNLTTVQMQKQQLTEKFTELHQEYRSALETSEELTDQNKNLQTKLNELIQIYNSDIQAKEEQIRKITQEEFKKYEEQIERISHSYQIKENSHLQQLAFFEEEEHRLQEKIQRDKEKFEETYREIYNEVEKIKYDLESEREELHKQKEYCDGLKAELQKKEEENLEYLQKLGENELRIQQLERIVGSYNDKIKDQKDKVSEKVEEVEEIKRQLEKRIDDLEEENQQLQAEIMQRESQIVALNSQLEESKNRGHMMNRTSFPIFGNEEAQPENRQRKETEQSLDIEKVEMSPTYLHPDFVRSRKESVVSQSSKKRRASGLFFTQQQLDVKIQEIKSAVSKQLEISHQQILKKQLADQMKQLTAAKDEVEEEYTEQIKNLKKQIQTSNYELKKLQRQFQSNKEEHETEVTKMNRLYEMNKAEKEAIEQSYISYMTESKRDKEGLNVFKNQNKELQNSNKDLKRQNQQLQGQVEQLKKLKQKLQARELKEKSSSSSESSSAAIKEMMEKYGLEIKNLIAEKDLLSESLEKKDIQIEELIKTHKEKLKEHENTAEQLEKLNRQNEMLQDLLDHERKDRTLRTVPSLASLPDQQSQDDENFKQFYNQAGEKQGQIIILQREVENLKEEMEELVESHERKVADIENQMSQYIQEVIRMKMVVAEAEMKASEKTHLYNQLKKKFSIK